MAQEPKRHKVLNIRHFKDLGQDQGFAEKLFMTGIGAAVVALGVFTAAPAIVTAVAGLFTGFSFKGLVDKIKAKISVNRTQEETQEEAQEEAEENEPQPTVEPQPTTEPQQTIEPEQEGPERGR
jgi:flagellar biosynthesis component FlhA